MHSCCAHNLWQCLHGRIFLYASALPKVLTALSSSHLVLARFEICFFFCTLRTQNLFLQCPSWSLFCEIQHMNLLSIPLHKTMIFFLALLSGLSRISHYVPDCEARSSLTDSNSSRAKDLVATEQ